MSYMCLWQISDTISDLLLKYDTNILWIKKSYFIFFFICQNIWPPSLRGQKANIHIRKHTLFLKRMNICNFILYFMMNHLKLLLHTYHVQIKSSFCHFTIVPALTVIVSVKKGVVLAVWHLTFKIAIIHTFLTVP